MLVEPQPDLAEQLRRERRARIYAVACSTPENAGKTLTLYLAGIQSSLDAGFYVAGVRRTGSVEVPVMTLDQVLEESSGNLSQAARRSGMDRSNFRRLLERHGVRNAS